MALIEISSQNAIPFMAWHRKILNVAIAITCVVLAAFAFKGLEYGIDFKGGTILHGKATKLPDIEQLHAIIQPFAKQEIKIQTANQQTELMLYVDTLPRDAEEAIGHHIRHKQQSQDFVWVRKEHVGPKVATEMLNRGLWAVALALLGICIYVSYRFSWQASVCAFITLFYDCIVVFGLYSVLRYEFQESSILALLITASYSINDTIVVFDRIRENQRNATDTTYNLPRIIDHSLNETLGRTLMTSGTTLLALGALYVMGGPVIAQFSLPIMVGIFTGTVSSIAVAAPLLTYMPHRSATITI